MSSDKDKDNEVIVNALKALVAKGLAKEEIIDGEPHYSLTDAGVAYQQHSLTIAKHKKSDPKNRN